MSNVYIIQPDGSSLPMTRVRCRNEDAELQRLLEQNLDLLPGDQINPDRPPRWLLVKREMPVPDPASGNDRWSVDLFFADQDAVPTLVECKRYADTRSRREVVGQMLEYAANGHHYWKPGVIREFVEETHGEDIDAAFARLGAESSLENYCEEVSAHLAAGRMRLVFFMEQAPNELKSIVEFLNARTTGIDVLIVEARQYEHEGRRIVAPTLFGFTEQVRREREAQESRASGRKRWNRKSFFEAAETAMPAEAVAAARTILERGEALDFEVRWGTGAKSGSFSLAMASVTPKSFLTINTEGRLWWNFLWLNDSAPAITFRERLAQFVSDALGVEIGDAELEGARGYPADVWVGRVDAVVTVLARLAEEHGPDTIAPAV